MAKRVAVYCRVSTKEEMQLYYAFIKSQYELCLNRAKIYRDNTERICNARSCYFLGIVL